MSITAGEVGAIYRDRVTGGKSSPEIQALKGCNNTEFSSFRAGIFGYSSRRFRASRSTDGYSHYGPCGTFERGRAPAFILTVITTVPIYILPPAGYALTRL